MSRVLQGVCIAGIGAALPNTVVTNEDLTQLVETSDEWITSRTGIRERRVVSGDEGNFDLALAAASDALASAGMRGADIDLIIVSNSTPENIYPMLCAQLQDALGMPFAAGFDVSMGCTGFVSSLITAQQFLKTGMYRSAMVVSVDVHSRYTDWHDRNTCVLFGDGAGACILTVDPQADRFLASEMHLDGSRGHHLTLPNAPTQNCPLVPPRNPQRPYVGMNGREVFKFAVEAVPKTIEDTLAQAGLTVDDLDYIVLHQANARIIQAIAERMKVPMDKMVMNLDKYGNTSAATIPIALNESVLAGKIQPGQKILLCGYGTGLAWATTVLEWTAVDQRTQHLTAATLSSATAVLSASAANQTVSVN